MFGKYSYCGLDGQEEQLRLTEIKWRKQLKYNIYNFFTYVKSVRHYYEKYIAKYRSESEMKV